MASSKMRSFLAWLQSHLPFLLIGALFLIGAINALRYVQAYAPKAWRSRGGRDEVGIYLDRFNAIHAALPQTGTFGYISDLPPASAGYARAYRKAQYALAPRILVDEGTEETLIGNFHHGLPDKTWMNRHGLTLKRFCGQGTAILQRLEEDPP